MERRLSEIPTEESDRCTITSTPMQAVQPGDGPAPPPSQGGRGQDQGRADQTSRRETKTFPTEAEAKQYAKEMLSDSHKIIAGTLLNGYQPVRRIISTSELHHRIEEKKN